MQHCGKANGDMYSLRDPNGKPHVTMDVDYQHQRHLVRQCKGKQNAAPDYRYWKYIGEFAKKLDAIWATEEPMGDAEDFHNFLEHYGLEVGEWDYE